MNVFSDILILGSIIITVIAVYSINRRTTEGAFTFGLLLICAALYSFAYGMEVMSNDIDTVRFWLRIEYIGISFIPALQLIFVLQFTNRIYWLKNKYIIPLLLLSILTLVIHYTNSYHNLYYTSIVLDTSTKYHLVKLGKGLWYYVHQLYYYVSVILTIYILVSYAFTCSSLCKKQVYTILSGYLVSFIVNSIYLLNLSPYNLDLNPIGITINCLFFSVAVFYYKIFDLVPIALGNVFESMRDGVLLLDKKNRIIDFNKAANTIFYTLDSQSKGKSIDEVFIDSNEITQLVIDNNIDTVNFNMNNDGINTYYQAKKSFVSNKNNKLLGTVIIIYDVTHQKNYENKLLELNTTKDKFFSIIAHDLRNPLWSFKNITELLSDSYESFSEKERVDFIAIMKNSINNIVLLLENLLEWSRSQRNVIPFDPVVVELNFLLNNIIGYLQLSADNKNIKIENTIPESETVIADINMIRTVLRNLISNAIKFTNNNGRIIISFKKENNSSIICIEDNGIGIQENDIDRLFKIDVSHTTIGTSKEKGTGLGLILCKEFIDKHNGKIWVESQINIGSKFFISLPYN